MSVIYCSNPKCHSILVLFQCFVSYKHFLIPFSLGGHCLHWSTCGKCKKKFHHAAPHGHTVYWSECLMSFCTPAVLADAYTLTKNAHVLLYPIPPMLTPYRQNGFSYQITLYHMTASSSPIVLARCSRCRIPKPLWSQFDCDNCDTSQLHCCHQYCGYVLFVYLSVTEYVFNMTAIKRYAGSVLNKWEIPHQFIIPENNAFVLATTACLLNLHWSVSNLYYDNIL